MVTLKPGAELLLAPGVSLLIEGSVNWQGGPKQPIQIRSLDPKRPAAGLVVKGQARFKFQHIDTGEYYELDTNDKSLQVVETVPGWTHDITNIGSDEMIVMLWANEIFDREKPDTFTMPVGTEA